MLQAGKSMGSITVEGYCWILPWKSIFRSFHVRCIEWSLNLQAEVRGNPIIFWKHYVQDVCPEICTAFSTDIIQESNLLLVPMNVSKEDVAAWIIGFPTITEAKRLASLITGLNCSISAVSCSFEHILWLCGCCCWLAWGRCLIKGSYCKVPLSAKW